MCYNPSRMPLLAPPPPPWPHLFLAKIFFIDFESGFPSSPPFVLHPPIGFASTFLPWTSSAGGLGGTAEVGALRFLDGGRWGGDAEEDEDEEEEEDFTLSKPVMGL